MSQSLPVATSYSTLGMSAVGEALNETRAPGIFCNYKVTTPPFQLAGRRLVG